MLKQGVSLAISLSLVLSLAACGSRLDQSLDQPSQMMNSMSVDSTTNPTNSQVTDDLGYPVDNVSQTPIELNSAKAEQVFANETTFQVNADSSVSVKDFTPDEIVTMISTDNFPFLTDEATKGSFTTLAVNDVQASFTIKNPFTVIKEKVKAWQQKRALKKMDKIEKFEKTNTPFAKELLEASRLKGKDQTAKMKELKAKYPNEFKGLKNKIAIWRWTHLEKNYPGLANDLIELSQLPADQRAARLTELKVKYPKFFHT